MKFNSKESNKIWFKSTIFKQINFYKRVLRAKKKSIRWNKIFKKIYFKEKKSLNYLMKFKINFKQMLINKIISKILNKHTNIIL